MENKAQGCVIVKSLEPFCEQAVDKMVEGKTEDAGAR